MKKKNNAIFIIVGNNKLFKMNQNDYKLILVGDSNVGKTTFIKKFFDKRFEEQYIQSNNIKVYPLKFYTKTCIINFNVWDIPGKGIYNIGDTFLKGSSCAIIIFDRTNSNSYLNIKYWYNKICKKCYNIPVAIVGNKSDLKNILIHTPAYYLDINLMYFDISVKNDHNIEIPFLWLIRNLEKDSGLCILNKLY